MSSQDLSNFSMLDLFRQEVESQTQVLDRRSARPGSRSGGRGSAGSLHAGSPFPEGCRTDRRYRGRRAADPLMEECFVAAQRGQIRLGRDAIDRLLQAVDLLTAVAQTQSAGQAEPLESEIIGRLWPVLPAYSRRTMRRPTPPKIRSEPRRPPGHPPDRSSHPEAMLRTPPCAWRPISSTTSWGLPVNC